ncbi:hypothetical protein [Helicobacter sp. 13S00477-4]|uniref:DUF7768 domain-containing protein n=1 Tax=Helicobacter sp. 13S00477-4 TaxID=1905759 RepID=UPI000BA7136D|nr:hypothetical protein [Helicobacter sp. 13S00477-4]PAF51303.1 hypothetical protein BKH44_06250 [Helicobacter sp. 13S00477-4]
MKQFCYVASPYRSVKESLEPMDWMGLAKSYAIKGARMAKEMGFVPICPVLLFWGVYDEESERNEVLEAGLLMLEHCQCILSVKTLYSKDSAGMKKEIELAKAYGLSYYEIYG